MWKITLAAICSFLIDSEINKIIIHLLEIKINYLTPLYDTVSLKLAIQNGYIVDYNHTSTAVLGCHSNVF